jgi:hypothetical protein
MMEEASFIRLRIERMLAGRVMVAPAKSWERRMATGLK